MKTVYTTDLIRYLTHTRGRSQAHYRQALTDVLDGITEQLVHGHCVKLIGFGRFYTRQQPSGKVRSIHNGEQLSVPERRVAAFRVGELLKRAVRQKPVGRPPQGITSSVTSALGSLFKAPNRSTSRRATASQSTDRMSKR